ncbi:MAG: molybdopterin molybdotransferase MoeA [Clostridiales bacterium]|nr:molybdopterin molybdotransferase MoeA [Clostridiales bacterium]
MRPDVKNLTPKPKALELMFAAWQPKAETEQIPLADAKGRILAKDIFAKYNLPIVRASHMDGVAVRSEAFADGMPDTSGWKPGSDFVRADTGDDFDDRFDAVIAIENVSLTGDGSISFNGNLNVSKGFNVKPCGADIKADSLILKKGALLRPQDLAVLAMGGHAEIPVRRRPVVSFIPTGSELVPAGTAPARGQNIDSNSILARELLPDMGAEPLLHPIVADDPEPLERALNEMLPQSDIVLLNAGTSKGSEDYCATLLKKRGEIIFQGVAAVPGRPMTAAIVDGTPVINLSGPSFAAFYSMDWMVRALICHYLDRPVPQRETVRATLTGDFNPPPLSIMAAFRLEHDANGNYLATPLALRGPKSAGNAAVMTTSGVYVSAPGDGPFHAGDEIEIELMCNRSEL